jgi:plastocyanin
MDLRDNTNRTGLTRRAVLRRTGAVALSGGGVVLLQACGGTTQEPAPTPPEPTSTPPPATEPTAAAEAPGAETAAPGAAGLVVKMNDQLKFDPEQLTIQVGDTVTWRTVGAIPHTSTCDPTKAQNPDENVKLPDGAATWDSGLVSRGEEFSHTFDVAGDYTYFCIPHEAAGMVAFLTVTE